MERDEEADWVKSCAKMDRTAPVGRPRKTLEEHCLLTWGCSELVDPQDDQDCLRQTCNGYQ